MKIVISLIIYSLISSSNLKYSEEIKIDANIDKVVDLFENPYNMSKWVNHFERYEIISGDIREVGSKAKIISKWGDDEIIMIEEVVTKNLPHELIITYTSDNGVFNIVTNKFIKISEEKTQVINKQEFQFQNDLNMLKMRISNPSGFDNMFRNTSKVYLESFKKFVENQE